MIVGEHPADEQARVVAGIGKARGAVGEIVGNVERQVVAGGQLPGIGQRRERQGQVVGGKQRCAGRGGEAASVDGDVARTAGIGNGIDPGAAEIGSI